MVKQSNSCTRLLACQPVRGGPVCCLATGPRWLSARLIVTPEHVAAWLPADVPANMPACMWVIPWPLAAGPGRPAGRPAGPTAGLPSEGAPMARLGHFSPSSSQARRGMPGQGCRTRRCLARHSPAASPDTRRRCCDGWAVGRVAAPGAAYSPPVARTTAGGGGGGGDNRERATCGRRLRRVAPGP